jgi:hypothetical protein
MGETTTVSGVDESKSQRAISSAQACEGQLSKKEGVAAFGSWRGRG